MMFRQHIPTILTGAVAAWFAVGPALACKCALVPRDRTIISTPLVFEGRVLKIETTRETGDAAQVTTLMVVKSVKGMSDGETVMVTTHTDSASCGFDFRSTKPMLLVGAYRDQQGRLSVRNCTMYNLNR